MEFNGHGQSYVLRDYIISREYDILGRRQRSMLGLILKQEEKKKELLQGHNLKLMKENEHKELEESIAEALHQIQIDALISGELDPDKITQMNNEILQTLILSPKDCNVDEIPADLKLQMFSYITKLFESMSEGIAEASKKKS